MPLRQKNSAPVIKCNFFFFVNDHLSNIQIKEKITEFHFHLMAEKVDRINELS